jgi:hypothetical protein
LKKIERKIKDWQARPASSFQLTDAGAWSAMTRSPNTQGEE